MFGVCFRRGGGGKVRIGRLIRLGHWLSFSKPIFDQLSLDLNCVGGGGWFPHEGCLAEMGRFRWGDEAETRRRMRVGTRKPLKVERKKRRWDQSMMYKGVSFYISYVEPKHIPVKRETPSGNG